MSEIDLPGLTQNGFLILPQVVSLSADDKLIEKKEIEHRQNQQRPVLCSVKKVMRC
jgi:hypothetical protein